MDINPKDEVSELTGVWGVVGYMDSGSMVPIGVYSCWAEARLAGSAWLKSTPNSDRVEAERLYKPLTTDEEYE